MKLILASVALRPGTGPAQALLTDYLARLAAYTPAESQLQRTDKGLLAAVQKQSGRTTPWLVLLDARGVLLSSEELASRIRAQQDAGRQIAVFAVGPADGWSASTRALAAASPEDMLLLSLGPMTLPHELARVVLAEQLYRAFTILAGHPYHCGH